MSLLYERVSFHAYIFFVGGETLAVCCNVEKTHMHVTNEHIFPYLAHKNVPC